MSDQPLIDLAQEIYNLVDYNSSEEIYDQISNKFSIVVSGTSAILEIKKYKSSRVGLEDLCIKLLGGNITQTLELDLSIERVSAIAKSRALKPFSVSLGGDFDCGYNQLTSLKGSPKEVNGDF